ncbi:hypothetical protein [Prochlorococcus marinus]|uniref:Uncharacterized protein n=1 Tax=Prochlorococcus marinus (strain MIT 9211) TaxID=93059 RepID=A9BBC3_PROM4|nr:hypothetical protein [Prochlorococcus marinus]ABX09135.1 Hypothetical protein P9211_12041 [Prochlorococcus marinus str. MIT 9211]
MRTKMSPRRALATATLMAIFPTGVFVIGSNKYSAYNCNQISTKLEISSKEKKSFELECNESLKKSQWLAFYYVLFTSILVNWPVIRWLDDRQWYREWIREEDNS